MSYYDYAMCREIVALTPSFDAIIMAAMRTADTHNLERLRASFPRIWDELERRYNAPGGRLPGEEHAE